MYSWELWCGCGCSCCVVRESAGECGRNVLLIIGNTSYLLETVINKSLMSVNDVFIIRF